MPSLFRANVGLNQRAWEFHKLHPGRLSRLCQNAVDQEIALQALPDGLKDVAFDEAATEFFNRYDLQGDYAIESNSLIKHEATEEQIATDARYFDVKPQELMGLLEDLFDLEVEAAMRRRLLIQAAIDAA